MIRKAAALITAILLAVATQATPVLASPGEEASFVSLINQERADRGLTTLEVYWDLVDDARTHSDLMSDADRIFHSSNLAGVTTGWSALGENVGVGPAVGILHEAFMNSAGHRDNILGDWDTVGVGVTNSAQGYMFVTVVFMKTAQAKPAPVPVPAPEPVQGVAGVAAVAAVAPAPGPVPTAVAAAAPAPTPEPIEPAPAPERTGRLIDRLLAGDHFPFSLV
ncbi:MAG TPA: CAP domain-containing protein [Acidimicrobiia bacterium]|nr:CAP domain-containing protein [Acidimicrobiia bacterium]